MSPMRPDAALWHNATSPCRDGAARPDAFHDPPPVPSSHGSEAFWRKLIFA
jgi:hypothetical protein